MLFRILIYMVPYSFSINFIVTMLYIDDFCILNVYNLYIFVFLKVSNILMSHVCINIATGSALRAFLRRLQMLHIVFTLSSYINAH